MTEKPLPEAAAELELCIADVIRKLQKIQRAIRSTRQPASMLELERLKALGEEYAKLVEKLSETY